MPNPVFKENDDWFFLDEVEFKRGPFYTEEEANQERSLYIDIDLLGTVKKIDFPKFKDPVNSGLSKEIWDWYDGPLIGTYEDEQGTCLFCMWNQETTRTFLSFRDLDGLSERIKDFYKNGYKNDEAPPIITYILRTEKPIAWFELS